MSGEPEADDVVAMVTQVGGPQADGGADGGSDYGAGVPTMDEELFAYIGPEQRSLESHLKKQLCKVLFKIRTQLRSGKARCGRVLQQQELISLRAQELELVKEQQLPGRNVLGWRRRVRRGHVSG